MDKYRQGNPTARTQKEIFKLMETLKNIADLTPQAITTILDKWGRGKDLSITSLPSLDNLIWGLRKRKLCIVGGRPGQGKSSFMAQLGWDFAKQGKKTVMFSLEMTEQVVIERLLCNECEINNYLVNTGSLVNEMDKYDPKIQAFYGAVNEATLAINTTARTFKDIVATMKDIEVDCVIIDYVQLIRTAGDRRSALEEFVRDLREYAIDKNACVILGSQVNRTTHEGNKIRPPAIWNLKETGALEESADLIMLVHWQYQYDKNEDIFHDYEIDIAKNRDGRVGTIKCVFKPEHYKLKETENVTGYDSQMCRVAFKEKDEERCFE